MSDWKEFFNEMKSHPPKTDNLNYNRLPCGGATGRVTSDYYERMYQAFRARLIDELTADGRLMEACPR